MTAAEYADMCATEVCERVARALVDINDACDDECPLTARQKTLVGTALLRECIGLNVDLAHMFSNAAVLEKWSTPEDMTPLGDAVEAWLATRTDDGEFLQ